MNYCPPCTGKKTGSETFNLPKVTWLVKDEGGVLTGLKDPPLIWGASWWDRMYNLMRDNNGFSKRPEAVGKKQ